MPVDPRTPVIVGVAQEVPRRDDPRGAPDPTAMMASVARAAAADSGGRGVLEALDSIRVVGVLSWRYGDPGRLVAGHLGVAPRQSVVTRIGGNSPQFLVNDTALAIERGELDVALITGAEAMYTRRLAQQAGVRPEWPPEEGAADVVLGEEQPGSHEAEMARGMVLPVHIYPVFENALRAAAGRTIDEHQVAVSELWARFSEVASRNPHAWNPGPYTAEEIRTVGPDNRMIGFPYTKLMNSNIVVDMAAAVLLCSAEAARRLGVPEDRWVFLHSGVDASDHWFVSDRAELHASPAIRVAGRRALELARTEAGALAHVDLYSCFPSAVQIAAAELGLPLDRDLTVTGGLCFAGGPANNYVTHSIAAMVERLRGEPDAYGLCSAVGWYLTKHAIGVYSCQPPAGGFRYEKPQAEIDALPSREVVRDHDGPITVESYTVVHDRDGSPSHAIVACLLADGRRAWGTSNEAGLLKAFEQEELIGRRGRMGKGGTVEVT